MNYKIRRAIFILGIVGPIQYIILTAISMYFYPGGTYIDPTTLGYSFWLNFFSSLAGLYSHSGVSNYLSLIIFIIAQATLNIIVILKYVGLQSLFKKLERSHLCSLIGTILAIISVFFNYLVLIVPWDYDQFLHVAFAYVANLLYIPVTILYFRSISLNEKFPKIYGYFYLILTALMVLDVFVLIFAPETTIELGLLIRVATQKIMVYGYLLVGICVSYGAFKVNEQFNVKKIL
jgi:hypothetical protein